MAKPRESAKSYADKMFNRVEEVKTSRSQDNKESQEAKERQDIWSKKKKNYLIPVMVSNRLKEEANKLTALNFERGDFKNIHESDVISNIIAKYFNLDIPDDMKVDI